MGEENLGTGVDEGEEEEEEEEEIAANEHFKRGGEKNLSAPFFWKKNCVGAFVDCRHTQEKEENPFIPFLCPFF